MGGTFSWSLSKSKDGWRLSTSSLFVTGSAGTRIPELLSFFGYMAYEGSNCYILMITPTSCLAFWVVCGKTLPMSLWSLSKSRVVEAVLVPPICIWQQPATRATGAFQVHRIWGGLGREGGGEVEVGPHPHGPCQNQRTVVGCQRAAYLWLDLSVPGYPSCYSLLGAWDMGQVGERGLL